MNETIPPFSGYPAQSKTSGLAISSLVLGILGLVLLLFCVGPLFAIPGVICGHMAHSRIKRSAGALTGQGLAVAGLVTGYIGIACALVMIPMMLSIAIPNFVKARNTSMMNACLNHLRQIDAAKPSGLWKRGRKPGTFPRLKTSHPISKTACSRSVPRAALTPLAPLVMIPSAQLPDTHCRSLARATRKMGQPPIITQSRSRQLHKRLWRPT
jgi:hypothetical protein